MGDVGSLLVALALTALNVVNTLIMVSVWRSGHNLKARYLSLMFLAIGWYAASDTLFALVGVPFTWQVGADIVLAALMVVALVLLYRHRHDPDPEDADAP